MRTILLGRKPVACDALRYMRSRGAEVVAVSTPGVDVVDPYPERLVDVANHFGIPVVEDQLLYDLLAGDRLGAGVDLRNIDLVISIVHQNRIRRPLLELGRLGCVNFHPAPLPEYRGWGTYNMAILEGVKRWGASAHFVDENFDTGPLIRVRYFDVDCSKETCLNLQRMTQPVMLALFKEVFDVALAGGQLKSAPQGPGRTFKKREVMALRYITPDDPPEMAERKVRAFWHPPQSWAEVEVVGARYPVVNQAIIHELFPVEPQGVRRETPTPAPQGDLLG